MRALSLLVLLLSATACGPSSPRGGQTSGAPAQVEAEQELELDDQELLEPARIELEPTEAEVGVEDPRPAPLAGSHPDAAREPPSARTMELVHDGPLARATYGGGKPMYTADQLETDEGWKRHGTWQAWHEEGQLWEAGSYYLGKPHGLWEWWYENGEPQARGDYDEGLHVGPWTYFHENGQVMASGVYESDRPVGVWRIYDEAGNLVSEADRGR